MVFFMLSAYAKDWSSVDKLLFQGVRNKLYPGAVLVVGSSKHDLHVASVGDATIDRIYDIASLTKVVATTIAIMLLEERGQLKLDDKIGKFLAPFATGDKAELTIEDLLRHQAGFPSGMRPLRSETYLDYFTRLSRLPLSYRPRTQTLYSDLSMIILGRVVEVLAGHSLDAFCRENIFLPLKMDSTDFKSLRSANCAPTSPTPDCVVHDPTAFALRPRAIGNAGVFSTAQDLARFARMILNLGQLDGVRILASKTVEKMLKLKGPRGLGWDFASEYSVKPRGDVFPEGISFGHTGYTGTTLWIDPRSASFYVFLSNRVRLGDEETKKPFGEFRHTLSTAIGTFVYEKFP
jgi:CubicO group peptidase (beta-lactamase class C family)